jgi:hypothetical protein
MPSMSICFRNESGSRLIPAQAPAILAIRGLLLVGDFSTTILTGGRILRKCLKYNENSGSRLKLMPLGTGCVHFVKDDLASENERFDLINKLPAEEMLCGRCRRVAG